jgi:hypothetical protein
MIKNAGGEQVKDSFKHVSVECSWLEFESKEDASAAVDASVLMKS